MSCDANAMSEYLDGRPAPGFEAHLAGCPACRAELDALRQADAAVRSFPALEWRPELTERILRRARPRRLWVAAAAALALAVVPFLAWPRPSVPREDLARTAGAVRLLANQAEADPEVLRVQAEQLGLPELTRKLQESDVPEVRAYAAEVRVLLERGDVQGLATVSNAMCLHFQVEPAPVTFTTAWTSDIGIFARGQLQIANGDVADGTRTLQVLLESQPETRFASRVNLTLGRTLQRTGDSVGALSYYVSISEPAVLTQSVALDIQTTSTHAGIVLLGQDPITQLEPEEVRRRVVEGQPTIVVHPSREVSVLGLTGNTIADGPALVERGTRRVRLDPARLSEQEINSMDARLGGVLRTIRNR